MRKFVSWAKRGLIVLSPLSLAMAMAASAAGPSDSVSPSLRAAMERDLGLTSAQLSQYLKIERLAALQEKQLAKAQGRNFAGSWIEHKPNGSFQLVVHRVVATTSWKLPLGLCSIQLPAKLRPWALASCFSCSAARRSILRYWESWAEVRPRSRSMAARSEGDTESDGPAAEAAMAMASERGESTIRPRLAQDTNLRICKSPVGLSWVCRTCRPCGGDAVREGGPAGGSCHRGIQRA